MDVLVVGASGHPTPSFYTYCRAQCENKFGEYINVFREYVYV